MFATALAILITCTTGHLTIPSQELGYVYKGGHPCAKVKLASYVDLTCPYSAEAFNALLQVADSFSGHDVQLRLYLFSLPYHRNSHLLAKTTRFLDEFLKSTTHNATVFDWMKVVFDNMDRLTTQATANTTEAQVVNFLATLAQTLFPIDGEQLKQGIYNRDVDLATRLEWKYGITRRVYGTPMFTVNDVFVGGKSTSSASKLTELLGNVLTTSSDVSTACFYSLGGVTSLNPTVWFMVLSIISVCSLS